MRKNFFLAALLILTTVLSVEAAYDPKTEIPKLQQQLANITTPRDSLPILYDIFDLGSRQQKLAVGQEIFGVAHRAGDVEAQLDIARLLTSYISPSELIKLQQKVAQLPASQSKKETMLFLDMKKIQHESRSLNVTELNKKVSELIGKINTGSANKDPYTRLLNLYKVTAYLRNYQQSDILFQFMDSLENLVESKNFKLYALRNMVYTEAALIYTDALDHNRAIKADKHLLNVISQLKNEYQTKGRKYRDFSQSRFNVLRRMMRNYKGMSPQEVDYVYSSIMELSAIDPVVKNALKTGYVNAYYDMAKKRYAEAIPKINKALSDSLAQPVKVQLLQMLVEAAQQTNDTVTLVRAMSSYNQHLSNIHSNSMLQKYHELELAYDVANVKANNTKLQLDNVRTEKESLQKNMSMLIALWIICIIALILLLFYWTKYREHLHALYRLADNITHQRDQIKFRHYHNEDAEEKFPTKLHNKKVPLNKLVENILSDTLFIAAIGKEERENHRLHIPVSRILDDIKTNVEKFHPGENKLHIKYPAEDITIIADRECLEYLIGRIILTAMERTNSDLYLETGIDRYSNMVRFTLVHHGQRIPVGSEEILFDDFTHIDYLKTLDNSALFISRMSAFLLRCSITYNPYADGPAHLVIAVPINGNL